MSFVKYAAYKDSGVEWLGGVPEHWVLGSLKHMAQIRNGSDYKEVESADGDYPVIGSGGQFSRASKYLYDGESVLLGRKGTIDKPLYVNGKFWTVDTMFYTEISRSACAKFVYYSALVIPFGFYSTSTALPSMTQADLLNHAVAIPSLQEQIQIARFLDHETARIDALVEEQQRLIALLKEKRQAVISHAVTKGLDPNVPMKDSGVEWLGEVPAHWDAMALKWRARIRSGDGISPSLIEAEASIDSSVPVIGGNGVMGFTSQANTEPPVIVIGRVGALCGNIHRVFDPVWVSDNALVLDVQVGSFCLGYLAHVLDARNLNEISDKSAQPLITGSKVTSQCLPCPSLDEQQVIAEFVDSELAKFDELMLGCEHAIDLLQERRSALISAAVTGKIDLRDWQPPVASSVFTPAQASA